MAASRVRAAERATPVVLAGSASLRADIVECPRRDADPPGDPCIHRFREAVAAGAVRSPCRAPRTRGASTAVAPSAGRWRRIRGDVVGPPLDRLFVQVGAGAFAASAIAGFTDERRDAAAARRADRQLRAAGARVGARAALGGPAAAAAHWGECMWPWEHVGSSAADGILDDETYDWIPVVRAMGDSNGTPVVVSERLRSREANELGRRHDRDQCVAHGHRRSGRPAGDARPDRRRRAGGSDLQWRQQVGCVTGSRAGRRKPTGSELGVVGRAADPRGHGAR